MRIEQVWINGKEHHDFDPRALTVKLPKSGSRLKVRVRLTPANVHYSVDLLECVDKCATISLAGSLDVDAVSTLKNTIDDAHAHGVTSIAFEVDELESIAEEVLRLLAFTKQKLGAGFDFSVVNPCPAVREVIEESGYSDEIRIVEQVTSAC